VPEKTLPAFTSMELFHIKHGQLASSSNNITSACCLVSQHYNKLSLFVEFPCSATNIDISVFLLILPNKAIMVIRVDQ
jgi:hypothetical protein